ncbi:MAG: class II aldolase/adducin family protein [Armatimonadota bacterium]
MYTKEYIKKICQDIIDKLIIKGVVLDKDKISDIASLVIESLSTENEESIKQDMVKSAKKLYDMGFLAGTSGNISVKLGVNAMLITPSGANKADLTPDLIIKTDMDGNYISGKGKPSSELKMHSIVYRKRPDVNAIVHAHPSFATGFASAGISLDQKVLPEAILILGEVPLVEYATPSTREVPENLERYLDGRNAFLLANHGALTLGPDLASAIHRMETLELFAKVILISRVLGGEKLLTQEQLDKLAALHG